MPFKDVGLAVNCLFEHIGETMLDNDQQLNCQAILS